MAFAVLLVNLGSPDAPTAKALRPYLREFLSDPRVIDWPKWRWWPILHGIVLRVRPKRSAALYKKIWTDQGAPLLQITKDQVSSLQKLLAAKGYEGIYVDYAMRYGNPSILDKLDALRAKGFDRILFVPMYAQYCDATTATVVDKIAEGLKKRRFMPEWRFVHHWFNHPLYIEALGDSVRDYAMREGMPDRLLLSFHGVPKRYAEEGDPYYSQCQETLRLLQENLGEAWQGRLSLVFQSRFGSEEWLKPYADEEFARLAKEGVCHLAVICPGFSADCLETLEEIAEEGREIFLEAGGTHYGYIPALNAEEKHIELFFDLLIKHTQDWLADGA